MRSRFFRVFFPSTIAHDIIRVFPIQRFQDSPGRSIRKKRKESRNTHLTCTRRRTRAIARREGRREKLEEQHHLSRDGDRRARISRRVCFFLSFMRVTPEAGSRRVEPARERNKTGPPLLRLALPLNHPRRPRIAMPGEQRR